MLKFMIQKMNKIYIYFSYISVRPLTYSHLYPLQIKTNVSLLSICSTDISTLEA